MGEQTIEVENRGAVAWLWLNRPALHNALNEELIRELTLVMRGLRDDPAVRVIVLSGRGRSFCAGADIESMKRLGAASRAENRDNARELADLFHAIASSPKPTIARVNGAAIGGGLGLVSACDIVIASSDAKFAASEVRLGLIPATIGPYVVRAIGPRWARRLFQTAERITAAQAERIGLVHETVEAEALDARVESIVNDLLAGAPGAQHAAKDLIDAVANRPITAELIEYTAERIAVIRAQDEAKEGLSAYLEKRKPGWTPQTS
ncbi:enoyl-CoA hydratase/isomerase family protein [Occallatibacter riparius]|uniref:Enoyl-CoA hydratase/isomerase family protein n=1 Tax=Occallatibacter riparius TaxID=1002689 RepID=A0A9J7BQE6_9BACT|nr:enoyl-CoA hydratase/isomerase family protein [Occallatibacter riparius]UWZ84912.1 enoyl-CoA hydratase/isomerase family protein [Occallatibacter riparius]